MYWTFNYKLRKFFIQTYERKDNFFEFYFGVRKFYKISKLIESSSDVQYKNKWSLKC